MLQVLTSPQKSGFLLPLDREPSKSYTHNQRLLQSTEKDWESQDQGILETSSLAAQGCVQSITSKLKSTWAEQLKNKKLAKSISAILCKAPRTLFLNKQSLCKTNIFYIRRSLLCPRTKQLKGILFHCQDNSE